VTLAKQSRLRDVRCVLFEDSLVVTGSGSGTASREHLHDSASTAGGGGAAAASIGSPWSSPKLQPLSTEVCESFSYSFFTAVIACSAFFVESRPLLTVRASCRFVVPSMCWGLVAYFD
jgi:hypothetical protein